MEITVNVDNTDLTTAIGEKREYDSEGDYVGMQPLTLGDVVVEELVKGLRISDQYSTLARRVAEIRDEMIRERIKAEVDAAFANPITETNRFGQPTGNVTTLVELIIDEVKKFMAERVDRNGYTSHSGKPRAAWYAAAAVEDAVKGDISAAVNAEKERAVAAIRSRAADLIAESATASAADQIACRGR